MKPKAYLVTCECKDYYGKWCKEEAAFTQKQDAVEWPRGWHSPRNIKIIPLYAGEEK